MCYSVQKLQHIRAGTTVQLHDNTSTIESLPPPPPAAGSVSSTTSRPYASTLVSKLRLPEFHKRSHQRPSGSHNGGTEAPPGIGGQTGGPVRPGTGPSKHGPFRHGPLKHENINGPCRACPWAEVPAQARPEKGWPDRPDG